MPNLSPNSNREIGLLKTLWQKDKSGDWIIHGLKGLTLKPKPGFAEDFFLFESQQEMMTDRPFLHEYQPYGWLTTFGYTDFLIKQSIVPIVAWVEGEPFIRCIGTGFLISCTGYLITACHVLTDPTDRKYVRTVREGDTIRAIDGIRMGVLIPTSPASTLGKGSFFFPFEDSRYWGHWKESPFPNDEARFEMLTDLAVCKISLMPDGSAHQPLTVSLNGFTKGENAIVLGYSEMGDIPITKHEGRLAVPEFELDLFVSVGPVMNLFPENHLKREVPTPGPCFDFKAKVPGKMSGAPILGGDGTVVRGVVSRSYEVEKHAYGAMVMPAFDLPLQEGVTLRKLRESGNEGIPKVIGRGL